MTTKRKKGLVLSVTAEVDAGILFDNEGQVSIDWHYCAEHATFTHKSACEFIIHCGDPNFVLNTVNDMKDFGCSKQFINSYKKAAKEGAIRVLFWA
jgi:hypothetical protein